MYIKRGWEAIQPNPPGFMKGIRDPPPPGVTKLCPLQMADGAQIYEPCICQGAPISHDSE